MEPVLQNPPNKKLNQLYEYLKSKKVKVHSTYDKFEASMADDANLKRAYDFIVKQPDTKVARDYDQFKLNLGVKKKDETTGPTYGPLSSGATFPTPTVSDPQVQLQEALKDPVKALSDLSQSTLQPEIPESEIGNPQALQKALLSQMTPMDDGLDKTLQNPYPVGSLEAARFDTETKQRNTAETAEFVGRISHPENYREKNPIVTGGKALWNVLSYQLPSALASFAAMTQETSLAPYTRGGVPIENYETAGLKIKQDLLSWANERQKAGQKFSGDLINTINKVEDPLDALNYVMNATGQAVGQIPMAAATYGGSAVAQEVGSIYLDSVNKIAEEKKITPEEVIQQGLDDPSVALAYGVAAGALDRVGAGKVMGSFKKELFKKAIQQRALTILKSGGVEAGTEHVQTLLEQMGTSQGSGKGFTESFKSAMNDPAKRQERIEGFVQGLIGGNVVSTVGNIANEKARPEAPIDTPAAVRDEAVITSAPVESKVAPEQVAEAEQPIVTQEADPVDDKSITDFANRVLSGEVIKGEDDLYFYNKNKDVINEALNKISFKKSAKERSKKEKTSKNDVLKKDYSSELTQEEKDFLKERGGGIYDEVIPARVIFKKPLLEDWKVFEKSKTQLKERVEKGEGSVQDITVKEIEPTDPLQKKYQIREKPDLKNLPILYKTNDGRVLVVDGHHRISEQILAGNTKIKAKVIEEDVPTQIKSEAVQSLAEEKSGLEPDQDSEPASIEATESESDTPEIDDKQVEFEWLTGDVKRGVVIGKAENGKIRIEDARGIKYRVDASKVTPIQAPEKITPSKKKKTITDPAGVREEVDEKRREINNSPKDVEKQGKKATVKTIAGEKMVNDLTADMHNKSAPLPRGTNTNEKNIRRNDKRQRPLGLVGDNALLKELDLGKLAEKAGKFYRKYFKTGRGMPNSVLDLDQKRMAYIAENEYVMKNSITDLKNAIPKAFKAGKVSDANIISMNNYLQGKPAQKLPKVITDVLDQMRPHVDGLSRVMMNEGIVSDEMKPTFMKNLGVYLNTSYRKFDDPYWAEYVPDAVKNQAVSVIRGNSQYKAQEYFARATRLKKRENNKQDLIDRIDARVVGQMEIIRKLSANTTPVGVRKKITEAQQKIKEYEEVKDKIILRDFAAEAAEQEAKGKELFNIPDEEINGLINYLLYNPEAPAAVLKGGKLGSKDLTVLKHKKDIDPIIKALMGEYTDPVLNFARTITKQANLIANHRFLSNMRQAGLKEGWLSEKPIGNLHAPVASEGSKTMSPMNGIFTSPEIAEALNEYNKKHVFTGVAKYYMALNSYVKVAKTIYSPVTHMRNFWGNMKFAIKNAHWRLDKFGDSFNALKDLFSNDQGMRDKITEYIKLGLVKNGAVAGELRQYVKDIQNGTDFFEKLNDKKIKKWKRAIINTAQDMYQAEDDLFKIYAFENEYARYKAALPQASDQEIKERSAKIVLDTYPTFSKVPEAIKEMRKIPVVGTFVSFPAEVIRVNKNTLKIAFEEMSDPATRSIGIQRLAGFITSLSITPIASIISRQLLGVSDKEDEDIRWILPPWEQNSFLWYHSKDGDAYDITDLSSIDPDAFLTDPLMQMIGDYNKGKSPARSIANGFNMFLEPFASEELLFQKIIDIERNIDPEGKQIYNPDADSGVAIKQISDHLRQALEPGAVKLAGDLQKTLEGYQGIHGDEYTKKALAYQLIFGLRSKKRDASTAMNFRVQDLKARVETTNRFYNQIKYKKEVTPEELAKAEKIKESALKRISDEANALYGAMVRLGVNPKEAKIAFFRTRTPEIIMKLPKE